MDKIISAFTLRLGLYETWQLPLTLLTVAVSLAVAIYPSNYASKIFTRLEDLLRRIADSKYLGLALIVLVAAGGPLALRPLLGIPDPFIYDEFSILLQAKTYLRGQFANLPITPNFETSWTLLTPTYSSQYPVLRSFPIFLGYLFGIDAWGGVLLSMVALTLAVYWMVREWINSRFAFVAALIVVLRYGLFSLWVNSYWGPAITALGGVLLLGGYKVVRSRPSLMSGTAVGSGILILMTTRPYESLLFAAPIAVALAVDFARSNAETRWRLVAPAAVATILVACGFALTFAENRSVTGDWKVFPYVLERQQLGLPPAWFLQQSSASAEDLHVRYDWTRRTFTAGYGDVQKYKKGHTIKGLISAEVLRFRNYWNFYVGFALAIPFVLGAWSLRKEPAVLFSAGFLGFALAVGSFDFSHYAAPGFGFFVLSIMLGFRTLRGWRPWGYPFGLSLSRTLPLALVLGTAIPLSSAFFGVPDFRGNDDNADNTPCCWLRPRSVNAAVKYKLDRLDGRQLVFVDSGPAWPLDEVPVANDADVDNAKTIFVNEDPDFDKATIDRYPGRRVWRLSWLDREGPCLQLFQKFSTSLGSPLSGEFANLPADQARGWFSAPADRCPGGITRESWTVSTKRE